ncbi:MAG: DUF2156 domain-containing protein [Ruminococcaceae bacterium]|nr:DUF2156 domain-containing protein [Oscillospiraceae bacterium]
MIDFKAIDLKQKDYYNSFFTDKKERGCECNFNNLILWGQQNIAEVGDCLVRLSYYAGHISYSFPIGKNDKEKALEEIIKDSKERGITCNFFGVYEEDKALLEKLYPDKFKYIHSRDSFDYVYDINDLATLAGRKFHSKRNHINRFKENFNGFNTELITKDNIHLAKDLAAKWYRDKLSVNPTADFDMEQIALDRALRHYDELGMEGLLLMFHGETLAFTMASRMNENTFDVHFEKAKAGFEGAYPVINNEFAKYLKAKYPDVTYLDREEDMGLEGLRKAKLSYNPHHLIEKYSVFPLEAEDDNK